ncbi:hypothetical protein GCM10020358_38150 [Amorphoplanes nipponensis]
MRVGAGSPSEPRSRAVGRAVTRRTAGSGHDPRATVVTDPAVRRVTARPTARLRGSDGDPRPRASAAKEPSVHSELVNLPA